MNAPDTFPRLVSTWLDEEAVAGSPDYLGEVLARTSVTRQRPIWASPGRWLPVTTTVRVSPSSLPPMARYALLAVLLLLLAVAAILAAGSRQPRLPAPPFGPAGNGRVFFDSAGSIVSANHDGSDRRMLVAAGTTRAMTPSVSPDGQLVAYLTTDPTQTDGDGVWVIHADGGQPVRISGDLRATVDPRSPPAWAPDSARVVFAAMAAGVSTMYVAAADGSSSAPLMEPPSDLDGYPHTLSMPTWSPSGAWIAFVDAREGGETAIAVVRPDGRDIRRLTTALSSPEPLRGSQLWAPDLTNRLLFGFGMDWNCFCNGISVVDVDDGKESLVVDQAGVADYGPAWSPDGSEIAFHRENAIIVLSTVGAAVERTLPDRLFITPLAWSPNGDWIYGLGVDGKSLARIDAHGHLPPAGIEAPDNASSLFDWQRLGE
jgi:dipeptidyl aminopeptidase/acylaminoacyl peptidase